MPIKFIDDPLFDLAVGAGNVPSAQPEGHVIDSAFRLNNPITNAIDHFTRPTFKADPTYTQEGLKSRPEFDSHPWRFVGVQSLDEEEDIVRTIQREDKDRQVVGASGWAGTASAVAAGMLDPTLAIPATWAVRGARLARTLEGAASGALLTGGAVAAQEAVLQANQETRTAGESAMAIGGGAIIGGILGGAIGGLSRAEVGAMAKAVEDGPSMVPSTGNAPIPGSAGAAANAAADLTERGFAGADAVASEGLAPAVGGRWLQSMFAKTSPVLRPQLAEELPNARALASGLSDAGVNMADNVRYGGVTAEGGTIENQAIAAQQRGMYAAVTSLDEQYRDLYFSGSVPRMFADIRARVGGEVKAALDTLPNGISSRTEFNRMVTRVITSGEESPIPQVNTAAKTAKAQVYDPLWARWKVAHDRHGLSISVPEFKDYINRVYNVDAIVANEDGFKQRVAQHVEKNLINAYRKAQDIMMRSRGRAKEELGDLKLAPEERRQVVAQLEAELKAGKEGNKAFIGLKEKLNEDIAKAKEAGDATALAEARAAKRKAFEEKASPFAKYFEQKGATERRLKNLRFGGIEDQRAALIDRAEKVHDQMMRSTERFAEQVRRLHDQADSLSDEVLDVKLEKLKDSIARDLAKFDHMDNKLKATLNAGDAEELGQRVDALKARLNDAVLKLGAAEDFDRELARETLRNAADDLAADLTSMNARRAARYEGYLEEARAASPERVAAKVDKINKKLAGREAEFADRWRDKFDDGQTPSFKMAAEKDAQGLIDKILNNSQFRLVNFDLLNGERGPELARLLNMSDADIGEEFLERDVERLMHTYTRTMSADVALMERYGSVSLDKEFKAISEDYNIQKEKIAGIEDPAKRAKAFTAAKEQYDDTVRDLKVVVERLRHQHALPKHPRGLGHRLASVALGLNYLRLMGGMTLSSIPDAGRAIQVYGLKTAFHDGTLAYIKDFKNYKIAKDVLRDMGVATELRLDTRTQLLTDVQLNWQSRTKMEKALDFATNKMGVVSLMAHWNDEVKGFVGILAMSKAMRGIEKLANGKALDKDMTVFLNAGGISPDLAKKIWAEMEAGGAMKLNGTWLPETRVWKNDEARRALGALVTREANKVIVTPGVERPIAATEILGSADLAKLLFQFQSYGFSSITKMTMAGMQQNDASFYSGLLLMQALGGVSWYTKSMLGSDKQREEMKSAGLARWAAEMTDSAGTVPLFGQVNKILERTPLKGVSRFTGQEVTRSQSTDLMGALLGPTYDMGSRAARALHGFGTGEPTQGDLHNLRTLAAYQNLFYLRKGFDEVEEKFSGMLGLPAKRSE